MLIKVRAYTRRRLPRTLVVMFGKMRVVEWPSKGPSSVIPALFPSSITKPHSAISPGTLLHTEQRDGHVRYVYVITRAKWSLYIPLGSTLHPRSPVRHKAWLFIFSTRLLAWHGRAAETHRPLYCTGSAKKSSLSRREAGRCQRSRSISEPPAGGAGHTTSWQSLGESR